MSELSLRAYIEYIEDRLGRDATVEAVAQCRHILTIFPKHVDTYRILARATAIQENYMDALDLFQRVLSADPADFVAHIGMSECYKEDAALEQSIWHLERAFEQAPSNRDLQSELKKLYEQRDGSAPLKVQMTGGALARMYVKGKLYDQAIAELSKTLIHDPERLDLQTLLADALWHNHQEVAAGKVAAEVLKKLPYSLDANRILGQLWLKAGQPAEARPFIDRLKELDPYAAYRLDHRGENPPPDAIKLTMLEFTTEAHVSQIGAADWVTEIKGIEKQKGVTGPLNEGGSITDIFGASPAPAAPVSSPAPASPAATPTEMGAPDWLRSALGTGKLKATPSTKPDWLKDALGTTDEPPAATPSTQAAGENAPDWLKDVIQEAPPATPSEIKGAPPPIETAPDWLKDTLEPGTPPAPLPAASADAGAPDWLKDVTSGPPPAQPASPAPPAPSGDKGAPEWLASVLDEQTPTGVQKPTVANDRPKPSWLDDVLAGTPAAPPPQIGPKVVSTDMLNQIITGGAAPSPAPIPTTPLPDEPSPLKFEELGELDMWDSAPSAPPADGWLDQDTGLTREEKPAAKVDDEKIPDWLLSDAPVPPREEKPEPASAESDALPSWLTGDPADIPKPKPVESKVEDDKGDALPAWLAGDSPVAPAAAASKQDDTGGDPLPGWLASEDSPASGDTSDQESGPKEDVVDEVKASPLVTAVLEEEKPVAPPDEGTSDGGEAEEVPDWLSSGDLDSDDALKWLEEMAAKIDPNFIAAGSEPAPAKAEAAPETTEEKAEPEGDLEWLRAPTETKAEDDLAAKADEEEVPDWLKPEEEKAAPMAKASVAPTDPDTDEALAWLDEQVKAQGVDPDQPVAEALTPDPPPVARMPKALDSDAEAEAVSDDELPDWLKDSGVQEKRAKAMDAPDVEPEMADIPDLPVEADELAWLNDALKAEESSSDTELDDLFAEAKKASSVASDTEKDELPDWLKGDEEEKPAPVMEDKTPAVEAKKDEPPAAKAEEATETSEDLPDWLKGGEEEATAAGQSGLTAFLQAVEPAAAPEPPKVEPAPVAPPPPAPVAPTPVASVPVPVASAPIPAGEAGDKLKAAREQMSNGELQKALEIYEALVASGHGQDEAISDLMEIVKTRAVVNPKVYRVIGDAMMGKGQMADALDMYKKALDNF